MWGPSSLVGLLLVVCTTAITNPIINIAQAVPLKMQATIRLEGLSKETFNANNGVSIRYTFGQTIAEAVWLGSGHLPQQAVHLKSVANRGNATLAAIDITFEVVPAGTINMDDTHMTALAQQLRVFLLERQLAWASSGNGKPNFLLPSTVTSSSSSSRVSP